MSCPMWCGEYRRLVVDVLVLCRFRMEASMCNLHGRYFTKFDGFPVFMRNERCTPVSIAPNSVF
jgi:hypothetical protein